MHESAGDLVAILAALHFDKVVSVLLDKSCGNLFTVNELDRLGELSEGREIRVAFNSVRMSEVGDEPHDRSVPLTGGVFDVLVEVYQKGLVKRGLITQFKAAYNGHSAEFKHELLLARDYVGALLAQTWQTQRTIRECFAWREIAPPPGLVTASLRKLRDCGLGPQVPPAGLADVEEATRRKPVGPASAR